MTFAFIFDSVGGTEWLVLLGVILIVVGPKNLPSAARKLGKIMTNLRRAADEFKRQLMAMDQEIQNQVNDAIQDPPPPSDGYDPSSVNEDGTPISSDADPYAGVNDEDNGYNPDSPYPGHDYYDETQYQPGTDESSDSAEPSSDESVSEEPQSEPVPKAPKRDPYKIEITVSTAASKKGKAQA